MTNFLHIYKTRKYFLWLNTSGKQNHDPNGNPRFVYDYF